jgi:hypothetical protein
MSESSLNSFGSVLSFAIQLETELQAYFQSAGAAEAAKAAEKRKSKLERTRRENVVEITLEPIEGLHEADYALNTADTSAEGQRAAAQTAAQFYSDAAPKINVLQARRVLERCGEELRAFSL